MKKKYFVAVLAFASTATIAQAADLNAAVPSSFSPATKASLDHPWSGFYTGLEVGYGKLKNKTDSKASFDPQGVNAGIFAGYNHQFDNGIVLGGETDLSWSHYSQSFKDIVKHNDETLNGKTIVNWNGATRLRAGYGIGPVLPYVSAGIAYMNVKSKLSNIWEDITHHKVTEEDQSKIGWTLGGGADYALSKNVFARLDYRYNGYISGKGKINKSALSQLVHNASVASQEVRLGIAYKF